MSISSTAPRPDYRSLQAAAEWFAQLDPHGAAVSPDRLRWQQWLNQDPRHRAAWAYVEAVNADFGRLPGAVAHAALQAPARGRRRALASLAVLGATGLGAWFTTRPAPWPDGQALIAQARTARGQVRTLELADGARAWLNADTDLAIVNSAALRLVQLRSGEIAIASGQKAGAARRPLVVDTPEGRVQALGTRFSVRSVDAGSTQVAVFEGAVRITPNAPGALALVLNAGEQTVFSAHQVGAVAPASAARQAWVDGLLIADNMRLDAFLRELSRHRPGYLGCDPAVAALRLDGVFPLADTDRVLAMVAQTLPVDVRRTTDWWVTVRARD
ncbi:FecR domain-containing protein [Acidovorax cavernicola]|uniref:DUF4880 domain-containing protein n=1 Tax=Acidovorax cavernicola TaxID=1675792 RepID=A0A9X8GS71_9BURK|nr:FecR domain-containing protein [Acidovorax cavernicola]RIX72488.1 DUF4880 domain-containing protein [Acidovorax cavernicola]